MIKKGILAAFFSILVVLAGPAQSAENHTDLLNDTETVLKSYFASPKWEGVKNLIGSAKAVVIAPSFKSASLIVGYEKGTAVLLVRKGEDWSDPAFVTMSMASVGFQGGVKDSEVLMLILTRSAVDKFVGGVGQVSGTGGFALGSFGVGAAGSGSLSGGVEIMTVETSEGLALGSGLAQLKVAPNNDLNRSAYGNAADLKTVLAGDGKLKDAEALRSMLKEAVKHSWWD
jgi:lipid-binding SYLF domain-containing protein